MTIGYVKRDMSDRMYRYMVINKKDIKKLIVYTDGGSRGNPGPAAIGVVIQDSDCRFVKSYGKSIGQKTNNEAEYEAVAFALGRVKALFGGAKARLFVVTVNMDSELVARQLGGKYKIEEERLFPLFIKIWNSRLDFHEIIFHHIPREKNRDADRLVNEALDKEQTQLF